MKLWDCWVYYDWDSDFEDLLPPRGAEAAEAASPPRAMPACLTIKQVAAAILERELADVGALVDTCMRIDMAVAVREHGSGQPFKLFRGVVRALVAEEMGWPEEDEGAEAA